MLRGQHWCEPEDLVQTRHPLKMNSQLLLGFELHCISYSVATVTEMTGFTIGALLLYIFTRRKVPFVNPVI